MTWSWGQKRADFWGMREFYSTLAWCEIQWMMHELCPPKDTGPVSSPPKRKWTRQTLTRRSCTSWILCFSCLHACQACTKISARPLTCGKCNESNESEGFWQKTVSLLVVSRYCACDQCSIEDPGSCWIRGSSRREGALDGWWLWL